MPYDPWDDLLGRPHLTLAFSDHLREHGRYYPALQTIVLRSDLDYACRRCTLTHELIHAEREDVPCFSTVLAAKQEHAVDVETARRLITIEALVDAVMWTTNGPELAETLAVDVHTATCRLTHLSPAELEVLRRRWWAREVSA